MLLLAALLICQAEPETACIGPDRPPKSDSAKQVELTPSGGIVLQVNARDNGTKSLWVRSCVALREGTLEMLACRRGTKEHESIVAIDETAAAVQAGLLAAGFEQGTPARFQPDFVPPTGERLRITMHWQDGGEWASRDSKDLIRNAISGWHGADLPKAIADAVALPTESIRIRYVEIDERLIFEGSMTDAERKTLDALSDDPTYRAAVASLRRAGTPRPVTFDWVFAGSTWSEAVDGSRTFDAESGNLICVANFSDAIIDISELSSASSGAQLYEPYTERVPPIGTVVWLHIERDADATKPAAE